VRLRYTKGIHFECQRCAECCGDTHERKRNILMLKKEVGRISEVTKLKPEEFSIPSGTEPYRYVMRKREGKCIFLKGVDCQIYPQRPLLCRFYPFWLEEPSAESYVFRVSGDCPGVGIGKVFKKDDFGKMLKEAIDAYKLGPTLSKWGKKWSQRLSG